MDIPGWRLLQIIVDSDHLHITYSSMILLALGHKERVEQQFMYQEFKELVNYIICEHSLYGIKKLAQEIHNKQ